MNAADALYDSFVWFVSFVVAELRLDHRIQRAGHQTQLPPSHRVTKSATHADALGERDINANSELHAPCDIAHGGCFYRRGAERVRNQGSGEQWRNCRRANRENIIDVICIRKCSRIGC